MMAGSSFIASANATDDALSLRGCESWLTTFSRLELSALLYHDWKSLMACAKPIARPSSSPRENAARPTTTTRADERIPCILNLAATWHVVFTPSENSQGAKDVWCIGTVSIFSTRV